MFNHVRTLLLNKPNGADPGLPGEELAPEAFRALSLPTYLQHLRTRLFGSDPDRAMLNYRLKQYMAILHATELEQYVLALDPRITYDAAVEHDFSADSFFLPRVTQQYGSANAELRIGGAPLAPDPGGRMYHEFHVQVAGTTVETHQTIPLMRQWNYGEVLSLPDSYPLTGTGYSYGVRPVDNDEIWKVEVYLRPQWDLGQIAVLLENVGEPVMLELFGVTRDEPWNTFRNCWYYHPELPYRLGSVLLAMAYRMEEIRSGKG